MYMIIVVALLSHYFLTLTQTTDVVCNKICFRLHHFGGKHEGWEIKHRQAVLFCNVKV